MTVVRNEFPFAVEVVDPFWIGLKDGTPHRHHPVAAENRHAKVPVVVEMIPYRRRDGTVFRDLEMHPYWAGSGVACCRVDIRGAGDFGRHPRR